MKTEKWIIFGMLVALLAGCSGKKAAEISADAKVGSIEYKMLMNWFFNKFKCTSSQISECGLQETLDMLFRVFQSERGRRLAKKIVDFLLEDEGCAEYFPYNLIEELESEF